MDISDSSHQTLCIAQFTERSIDKYNTLNTERAHVLAFLHLKDAHFFGRLTGMCLC